MSEFGATATFQVRAKGGWKTPERELVAEFIGDQHRSPSSSEIGTLQRLAKRNNDILARPNIRAGHPSRADEMDWNTAQGLINFYLVHDRGPDNGDPVAPPRGGPEIESLVKAAVSAVPSKKSFFESAVNTITSPIKDVVHEITKAEKKVEKIPVVGNVVKVTRELTTTPILSTINTVGAIASGARIDHALLGAMKEQLKTIKDVAPYAQTVVSFVPGIGTGTAAAIAAGAALAEGQSITQAAKSAIRGALPGGSIATAAYDTALKVAGGESISQAAIETARAAISDPTAQKAFDVGVAVATGEKLQTAIAHGLSAIAPGQLQTLLAAGQEALAKTPGLTDAIKKLPLGAAQEGFTLAAGLLSHAGMNQKALDAVRAQLPADVRQGFDAALHTQTPHTPWLSKVASAAKTSASAPGAPTTHAPVIVDVPKKTTAPVIRDVPKKTAGRYAPYPPKATGVTTHGVGSLWGSSKWRWFAVYANGSPVAQRGPLWLSDDGAQREAAAFLESTQGRSYVGTVTRWDWDGQAWHQAPSSGLGAPPHHGGGHHGGGHPHGGYGGHSGGHPRIFRDGRGVPGWWGEYYPLPAEVVTTTETCRIWGDLVPIPPSMVQAVKTAIGSSGGRPTTMRGDDGTLYLFTVEDGGIAARPCASVGVGDWGQWKRAASDAWNEWTSEVADLWRGG